MTSRPKLGEILIEAGLLDESRLKRALADQRQWQRPLGVTLVKLGLVDEGDLLKVLGRQLDTPVARLEGRRIGPEVLELIPHEFAAKHACLPLFVEMDGAARTLYLAMGDPTDCETVDAARFHTGHVVHPVLVSSTQLEEAIERSYGRRHYDARLETPNSGDLSHPGDPQEVLLHEPAPPAVDAPPPENERQLDLSHQNADETPTLAGSVSRSAAAPSRSRPAASRTIVRALVQLLIDQGVISMDELAQRIRALTDEGP